MPNNEKIIYVYDNFAFDEPKSPIIKSNGAKPNADLIVLWKRIVFNMAVSNTDDHLKNHAFVLKKICVVR